MIPHSGFNDLRAVPPARVLGRNFKDLSKTAIPKCMPVQNCLLLFQIRIPTTFYSLLCQKGQFTHQPCPRRWFCLENIWLLPIKGQNWKFFKEIFACPKSGFSGKYLSKRKAGRVMAKSLPPAMLLGDFQPNFLSSSMLPTYSSVPTAPQ